jgi:hypothetical protein
MAFGQAGHKRLAQTLSVWHNNARPNGRGYLPSVTMLYGYKPYGSVKIFIEKFTITTQFKNNLYIH